MKSRYVYFPILLFLFIFSLDKLAGIHAIRKYGRPPLTPMENILFTADEILKKREAEKPERPLHMVLGTSRSDIFQFLGKKTITDAAYPDEEGKKALVSVDYDTRLVVRASELFVHYTILERIARNKTRPDRILVEISPEMFNKNSPFSTWHQLNDHIYDRKLMSGLLPVLDGREQQEILFRLMFPTYSYKFLPEKALSNFINGIDVTKGNLATVLLIGRSPVHELKGDYKDFPLDDFPRKEYNKRIKQYTKFLVDRNIMMKYEFSNQELNLLKSIVELGRKNHLNIVFWIPKVHPLLEKEWKKSDFMKHREEVYGVIRESGYPFFDGWGADFECLRFVDSSHLSARCAPYLMHRIETGE